MSRPSPSRRHSSRPVFSSRGARPTRLLLAWVPPRACPLEPPLPHRHDLRRALLYIALVGFALLAPLTIGRLPALRRGPRRRAGIPSRARFVARTASCPPMTRSSSRRPGLPASSKGAQQPRLHAAGAGAIRGGGGRVPARAQIAPISPARASASPAASWRARAARRGARPPRAERKMGDFPQLTADLAGAHYAVAVDSAEPPGIVRPRRSTPEAARRRGTRFGRTSRETPVPPSHAPPRAVRRRRPRPAKIRRARRERLGPGPDPVGASEGANHVEQRKARRGIEPVGAQRVRGPAARRRRPVRDTDEDAAGDELAARRRAAFPVAPRSRRRAHASRRGRALEEDEPRPASRSTR